MKSFELAGPDDDAALRRLLRENPLPGSISVTYEREPRYFNAAAIDGPLHQVFVSRTALPDGEAGIVAMTSRSVRSLYVNGATCPVGYLSQMRLNREYRRGLFPARGLVQGFEFCRRLHADGAAAFYLVSVIADNLPARRLLTAGLPGCPRLLEYTRLVTYVIAPHRCRAALPLPPGLRLERARPEHLPRIIECLQRNGARRQFSPCWTTATLCQPEHTPGLSVEDFSVVLAGEQVVGCLALWDQMDFKQTVVRAYQGPLRRWRRLVNWLAPLGGWPVLPEPDTPFHYAFASHLAVDGDDPRVFAALLRALYNRAWEAGYGYFMLGLAEADPWGTGLVRSYAPVLYPSQIYLAAWEDGWEAVAAVDRRLPGLEIAVL